MTLTFLISPVSSKVSLPELTKSILTLIFHSEVIVISSALAFLLRFVLSVVISFSAASAEETAITYLLPEIVADA